MDTSTADQLTETKDLDPPQGRLLRRGRIEEVLSEADSAVDGSRQENTGEVTPQRSFVNTGTPVRAPRTDKQKVSPTEVDPEDGFVPADKETVRERFNQEALAALRVNVSHVLPEIGEEKPASIVYQFNEAITGVDGEVMGSLYAFDYSGELSPFVPGRQVKRVVHVVPEDAFDGELPKKTDTYQAEIGADGIARWEKATDEQS